MNPWPISIDGELLARTVSSVARHRVSTVVGHRGIGKTTLVRAAVEASGRRPFWLVGVGDPVRRSAIEAICEPLPGGGLAEAAEAAVDRLVGAHGVLIIENAELLDTESAAIAAAIADSSRVPVVRIGGADGGRSDGRDVIEVGPLDRLVVAALVEEYVGGRVGSATVARLHRLSGGVPFIVRQLVEGAVADETLAPEPTGTWRLADGAVTITTELRAMIDDGGDLPAPLRSEERRRSMGDLERLRCRRVEWRALQGDRSPRAAQRRAELAWELGEPVSVDALVESARGALLAARPARARRLAAAAIDRGGGNRAAVVGSWATALGGDTSALDDVVVGARVGLQQSDVDAAATIRDLLDGAPERALRRLRHGARHTAFALVAEAECLRSRGELDRPRALIDAVADTADLPALTRIVGVERARIADDLGSGRPADALARGDRLLEAGLPGGLVDAVVLPHIVRAALAVGRLDQALRLALDALEAADPLGDTSGDSGLMVPAAAGAVRLLVLRGRRDDARRIGERYADVIGAPWVVGELRAWTRIGRGELLRPAQTLRSAASAARRNGLVVDAAELLHQAISLGDREAAEQLAAVPCTGEGVLRRLQAAHARAMLSGSAEELDVLAVEFQQHGYQIASLDVRAQAIGALRRRGRRQAAERRLARLERQRQDCWNPVTAALVDVDTDSRLTAREREVLASYRTGLTVSETARALGVAPETVATHLARARLKATAESGGAPDRDPSPAW